MTGEAWEMVEDEDCPMCGGPAREGGGMCHDCLSLGEDNTEDDDVT